MEIGKSYARFQLSDWWVDAVTNRIGRDGTEQVLEPRIMDLLVFLASRAGEVVTADEIHQHVWRGVIVSEDSIYQGIAQLRKALGDNASRPSYVATIPKKGYRLIAPVLPLTHEAIPGQKIGSNIGSKPPPANQHQRKPRSAGALTPFLRATNRRGLWILAGTVAVVAGIALALPLFVPSLQTGGRTHHISSIAVLPFSNITEDRSNDYFALGLSEELINSLARFEDLRVVARSSSFAMPPKTDIRDIADRLQVESVLEGSVRKAGDRVRVSVQLFSAEDGYGIWASTYDRRLGDIFAMQRDIANSVVNALHLRLTGSEGTILSPPKTPQLKAYDYYLLGRDATRQLEPKSLQKAIELFQQAITLDSTYAAAYSGLANAHLLSSRYGTVEFEAAKSKAEPAIAKALALSNDLAEPHVSLALLLMLQRHFAEAERTLHTAIALEPSYATAYHLLGLVQAYQGSIREAEDYLAVAHRLDPLNVLVTVNLAYDRMLLGRYDEALKTLLGASEYQQDSLPLLLATSRIASAFGNLAVALQAAQTALAHHPEAADARAALAWVHLYRGDLTAAKRLLKGQQNNTSTPSSSLAKAALAALYVTERKFEQLGELFQDRADSAVPMRRWDFLRLETRDAGYLGIAKLLAGDYRQAAAYLSQQLRGSEGLALESEDNIFFRTSLAYAYHRLGETHHSQALLESTAKLLEQARNNGWGSNQLLYDEARLQALMGDSNRAMKKLRQAIAQGFSEHWILNHDPAIDELRPQAEFSRLRSELTTRLTR